MNQEQIENLIDQKIAQYNTTQGGAKSSFTVPLHRHNGSDMVRVIMGDLAYDNRGLNFPVQKGQISFQIIPQTGNDLYINPPTSRLTNLIDTNLYVGISPNVFNNIQFEARTNFEISVGDPFPLAPVNTFYEFNEDNIKINSTAPVNGTGWYARLPVDDSSNPSTTLPPAPVLGDICYGSPDGGITGFLYVCESPGVWTQK